MITYDTTEAPQAQQEPVTHATADISRRGEIVRATHPSGRVGEFKIVSTWTSSSTGAAMMTLMRVEGGFSFDVRADQVEQPKECARRGCTAAPMSGSAYCTDVHERWDNPRVAATAVSR
jgi:hypothetical protein